MTELTAYPEVLAFLKARQSQRHFVAPAPSKAELAQAFEAACRAPDHGYMRPWRYVIFEGDARAQFGDVLAKIKHAEGASETEIAKAQGWFLRAPMVVMAVANVQSHPKIPAEDQEYAVAASVMMFQLALNAQGYDAMWRTGWLVEHEKVRSALGLAAHEHIVGFVYTGVGAKDKPAQRNLDMDTYVSYWSAE